MKFYEKYPRLKEKAVLTKILTETVFSTMMLENQQVAKSRIQEIVLELLNEKQLQGKQFFTD